MTLGLTSEAWKPSPKPCKDFKSPILFSSEHAQME